MNKRKKSKSRGIKSLVYPFSQSIMQKQKSLPRFLILFIQILILSTFLFTQNILAQTFEGGFFAGLSASQVDGDTYSGFNKAGLTAGGYISAELTRNSGWKAELRYIQKGAYKKNTEQDPTLYKLTIHYIEIPLMYQYWINDRIILEGGFSPDIYLGHKEENEIGELEGEERPDYHRFSIGANAGVAYKITDNIIAGARYTYSIIPIRDHASGQTYLLNRGQYNNVVSFSLYYHFD